MTNPYISDNRSKLWFNEKRQWHRIDGPALIWENGNQAWYINNFRCHNNKEFREAAKLSDEDMTAMILKYGNVK